VIAASRAGLLIPSRLGGTRLQSRVQNVRFPVLIGPTAGGKSDLAVDVALLLREGGRPAEVVTADSVQIFRGLDIGSAKPAAVEQRGIPHQLIDIVEPAERFTVSDWLVRAEQTIAQIKERGGVPVVSGGTHLYIKALLDGLFEGPEPDPALRESLRQRGLSALRAELERIDPAAAARIHPNDERRTIRALEVYQQTGRPISQLQTQWDRGPRQDCVLIGLVWPTELLNRRINTRVKQMMEAGLLEEVRQLWRAGRLGPQAREALGYKQLVRHLEGHWTLEEAVEQIKRETRRFAKNQRTWLRRLRATPGSLWIDAAAVPRAEWAGAVVRTMNDER
jgi:tRNA dimethylallyltransferase